MKIGLFAPSSSCSPERYKSAVENATKLGIEVVLAQDPSEFYGSKQFLFSSNSEEQRLSALRSLLLNAEVKMILAARGGYGAVDLLAGLKKIKTELLAKPPSEPIFVSGLSDVSLILAALDDVKNIVPVHGPSFINAFAKYGSNREEARSADELLKLARGSWTGYADLQLRELKGSSDSMQGKLCGGNLLVFASLVGTPYLPKLKNKILFIEEIEEKPYRIHRALSQLKQAGLLSEVNGILLGDFINCSHPKGLGPDIDEVFTDIFENIACPIYKGFPGGHGDLNLPLPFGVELIVDSNGVKLLK